MHTYAICPKIELILHPSQNIFPVTGTPKTGFPSTAIKSPHPGGKYASWGFHNRRCKHNPNSEVPSTNLLHAACLVDAQSVINLHHLYEMLDKTKADFKTGSPSCSLRLINNCINGRYQETPAHKV